MDITGVPTIRYQGRESPGCRPSRRPGLLGATVIVTGLSSEIAQTLVNIGVDLGKMNTVGDLQGGGIEEAESACSATRSCRWSKRSNSKSFSKRP